MSEAESAIEMGPSVALVPRYKWKQEYSDPYDDDDCDCDEVCVDRLTGQEVVRYDLGDPANYAASHGGWSKREWLENRGHDPDEEIEIGRCVTEIWPGEAEGYRRAKERRAQRDQEGAAAGDVLQFIGAAAREFSFKDWADGEESIIRPALEKRGYTDIGFYMIEEDSFGPLIRGVVAVDPEGKRVRFYYG